MMQSVKWWAVGLLCVLSMVGCGEAAVQDPVVEDPPEVEDVSPPAAFEVRIATWNVRRFFDTRCDSGGCGGDAFVALPTEEEFEARADEIAQAIRSLEADVILLQEIESDLCLAALEARLSDVFDVFLIGETRLAGSVDTAVLARGRVEELRTHRQDNFALPEGGETRFLREFLEVHLVIENKKVVVFVAHFKSKNNDDPSQRLAEATRAREIVLGTVDEVGEGVLVVLGGDLNDTPGSPAIDAIEQGGVLVRVAAELDPDSWTHIFRGNIAAIDHLFHATGRGEHVEGSSEVKRDNGRFGGSDHAALLADFNL